MRSQDTFSLGSCPQFSLGCDNRRGESTAFIWLHLSKHVLRPTSENNDYISLHVFTHDVGNGLGELQYYLEEATMKGVYINNPHLFLRLDVPANVAKSYTIVLSQQDRSDSNTFTLRAYGTLDLLLSRIPNKMRFESPIMQTLWPPGDGGKPLLINLTVDQPTVVCIRVEAPRDIG